MNSQDNKQKYIKELEDVIKTNKIAFFDHCFAFTTFSRATAYNHELDKIDTLKDLINKNRVKAKSYLLNKWIASDNATLQISAFKLLSEPEEHKKLQQNYTDHTTDGTSLNNTFKLEVINGDNKDTSAPV